MSRGGAGRLRVRNDEIAEPVLERVVAALAARVDLPFDRLADAQLIGGALVAAAARQSPEGVLCIDLGARAGGIDLGVGPLPRGGANSVIAKSALPGVGVVLELLVDDWSVDMLDSGEEMLRLRIGAGAPTTR